MIVIRSASPLFTVLESSFLIFITIFLPFMIFLVMG